MTTQIKDPCVTPVAFLQRRPEFEDRIRAVMVERDSSSPETNHFSLRPGGLTPETTNHHFGTNLRRLASAGGFNPEKTAMLNFAHEGQIHGITGPGSPSVAAAGRSLLELEETYGSELWRPYMCRGDAMITDVPGIALLGWAADCGLHSYVARRADGTFIIALAHCSWPTLIKHNIVTRTVQQLQEDYGVAPESIYASLAPSIGGATSRCPHANKGGCYGVDGDVLEAFRAHRPDLDPDRYFIPTGKGRFGLQIQLLGLEDLNRAGVTSTYASFQCSSHLGEPEFRFFSKRRRDNEHPDEIPGNHGAAIWIRT